MLADRVGSVGGVEGGGGAGGDVHEGV
jgi:hypothetical protein